MREWGILVVVASVQDAPFRMNVDFGKNFTQCLHNVNVSFLAGHSMMTWRVHSAIGKNLHLSSRVLGLPGDFKTANPGALKLHESKLLARCAPLEKRK
jgi:hypothetical protein